MSASVGPRGGARPPVVPASMPEPDLSHLTEEERKIIMAVLARQKEEEEKEEAMLKEEKPIQARTVNLVGQKKPPQQNDVRLMWQVMWVCNNCRKQQEILTKPGEWFSGPGKPGLGSGISDPAMRKPGDQNVKGRGERRPGHPRLYTQVSVDRDQWERERRDGRRLSKGRSLEHDPVGAGVPRWTEEGYHIDPNAPRHLAQPQPGEPLRGRHPLQPQGRGRGVGMVIGFESVEGIGGQPEAMLGQRTVVGGIRGQQDLGPPQLQPPELREPPGTGPGPGPCQDPLLRRSKREKAERMLRNDSLSSDQSESLRPPPPRPYKSKRGGAGKRQTSVSSSEEEGGTTPEYSSSEPQVELVVSRPIGSFESQKMERPSISVMSPTSPSTLRDNPQLMPGQLAVKLWYDKVGHQLIVNVVQATELPPRPDGRPRNPYVKMYFLPDRRDFRQHMLELTMWDQPRLPDEDSMFMGEILIELETAPLDDKPHWYKLQTHDMSSIPLPRPSPYMPRRNTDTPSKKLQRKSQTAAERGSRERGREQKDPHAATLEVPEQKRTPQHRSRSVSPHREEQGRGRSRPANVPTQRSLDDEIHHSRRSRSPTHYYDSTRGHYQEQDYVDDRESSRQSNTLPPKMPLLVNGIHKDMYSSTLPACLKTRSMVRSSVVTAMRSSLTQRVLRFTDEITIRVRTRSASTNCLNPERNHSVPSPEPQSCSQSLPRRRPASPRILIQHASPEDDSQWMMEPLVPKQETVNHLSAKKRQTRTLDSSTCHTLGKKLPDHDRGHLQGGASLSSSLYKDQRRTSCENVSRKSSDSDVSDVSAISRTSSASRISSTSYMSIQSERPRGRFNKAMHASGRSMLKSTSVSGEIFGIEHTDGSQSDTALGGGKKRRSSLSQRVVAIVGLPSRRSCSTSQLTSQKVVVDTKKKGKKKNKIQIQRSTEVGMAVEYPRSAMNRQASRDSTDGSMNSYSSEGNLIFSGMRLGADSQFSDFLDGLGPAQLVGRQTLATPAMGEWHK
ncbi:unnamed protein product [Coregonus sp. 'balchen']|nr:unnamed protein product [Coregonus sp. 'balchen']